MRSSWTEPYLWVHLAGIAAVPIFLELCLVGLAASQTVLPAGIGFLLVALAGISPILWMQWYRPFSIFSLVALALKPSELTETQRQILQRFKTPVARAVAVIVAILAFLILWQLNQWLPFHAPILKVPGGWFGGLLLAAVAFLLSNLFLQVPASVLMVLLTPERQISAANPYPVAQIPADFTLIGLQVKQILPPITLAPAASTPVTSAPVASTPVSPTDTPVAASMSAPVAEVAQLKTTQAEVTQPEITEPPIALTEESSPAERVLDSELAQAELSIPEIKVNSGWQETLIEAVSAIARQTPQVADTVVMIIPSVEATPQSPEFTQNGLSEHTEAEVSAPALPTVTDTIVTIGPPPIAAATQPSEK